ncbi:glycosyltransferase family A protein [Chryseobacterium sp. BIGb0232]|uniref:glycosyltransferase family 2 protein n=1 Tax=Chryseobacterium sp. BIGb0232 TaxID=2940598 RepID=UPI000F472A47|nr:glycosyltransferase family A protein [Chryseobacterium sp. BIGb0232]MCS4303099.1 alpha-1,3-rhamnosyltransferase [Chryseobacterium sp. BIGb0232]ROS14614.1 alpha-1,3-rhamnosyltransferase [Chryseobacterium nakagawai]
MEQPLVTVVVVSYNHSQFIKENLDSIKNQTYKNIQLIVGDDASPDHSVKVFEQWLQENNYPAEKNFHTQNTGLPTMLNECLELAKGKYIKIIAADDFLHPESIEKSVSTLEKLGNEYGMSFSHTHAVNNYSEIIEDIADYDALGNIDPYVFREELLKGNRIAALTVLLRTDVVRETGQYDAQFIIEDYYRWLKVSQKYLIAYIPEKLAYYRLHTDNISKVKADRIEMEAAMLQMMFDKKGVSRGSINYITQKLYQSGTQFPEEYINAYHAYPFRSKKLDFAVKKKLPVSLYKVLKKII